MAKAGGGFQRRSFRTPSKSGGSLGNNPEVRRQNAKKLLEELRRRKEQADAAKKKKLEE